MDGEVGKGVDALKLRVHLYVFMQWSANGFDMESQRCNRALKHSAVERAHAVKQKVHRTNV